MGQRDKIVAAVHGYIAGFEAGDLDAIMALYASNATVEDPVGTPIKKGHDALRTFYAMGVGAKAKLKIKGEPKVAGNEVTFSFEVHVDMGQGPVVIDVIDHMVFNYYGKITAMRAFFGPENIRPAS